MAQLLALTEAETEDCLSDMVGRRSGSRSNGRLLISLICCVMSLICCPNQVVAGTVAAKTDRLEGIVDFTELQVGRRSRSRRIDRYSLT